MGLLHRKYPHAGADKSGAIEAYHFSIKSRFFGEKKYMRGRRLDWLVHKLVDQVLLSYMHRKQRKDVGLVTNKKSINKTVAAGPYTADGFPSFTCKPRVNMASVRGPPNVCTFCRR